MGSRVDYDKHYRKGRGQYGAPFPEVVEMLESIDAPARVLDLGCGQGRDALVAARLGHEVVGVDLAAIGIEQMLEDAAAERLAVEGIVTDILLFRSRKKFDVVILDRVLHQLGSDDERTACLQRAQLLTRKGGVILVVDTPRHSALIRNAFAVGPWTTLRTTKNLLFAKK